MSELSTREVSALMFGNEKMLEVVQALAANETMHAQGIANELGVASTMVRPVLKRLHLAGLVIEHPRTTSRGPLYYSPASEHPAWRPLSVLCDALTEPDGLF